MPWARVDRANALSPVFVKGAIPDDAWWSPAKTTVLSEAWWCARRHFFRNFQP